MKKEKSVVYRNKAVAVVYFIFLFFLVQRTFYSVELTDEIDGIASIYNIYLGKAPLMTSWDYHTGWCLLVPFFNLFYIFSPNMEWIVLFFRILFILFIGLNTFLISRLLSKNIKNWDIGWWVCPLLFYIPASIFQINYNNFVVHILTLISVLLFTFQLKSKCSLRCFFCGILMGATCITYPTIIVFAILLIGWIYIITPNNYRKNRMLCYIFGGAIVAISFLIWVFSKGSVELFFKALNGMLESPHENSKGSIDIGFLIQTFYYPFKKYLLRAFTIILLFYTLIQLVISEMIKKEYKKYWNLVLLILYLVLNSYINQGVYGYSVFGAFVGFVISIYFSKKKLLKKYSTFWVFLVIYILTYSLTSDNKNVFMAFEMAGPMIYFLISLVIGLESAKSCQYLPICIPLILSVSGLFNVYSYVYRDEPIMQLTEQVEYGIYKGLYTTQERKVFVESIEKDLKRNIGITESVCAVTRAPMIYVMSRAQICAPQTWDAQFLARGYTKADPLLVYFLAIGETPDILVATSLDIKDFYNNNKYEINSFINQNYELYHREQIENIDVYLWKKNCTSVLYR